MYFVLALVLFTVGIYFLELFTYSGFIANHFKISTDFVFLPSLIALFVYRFILRKSFPEKLQ